MQIWKREEATRLAALWGGRLIGGVWQAHCVTLDSVFHLLDEAPGLGGQLLLLEADLFVHLIVGGRVGESD
ncbi:MAG: hypothetical protein ACE5HK_06880 [Candidatus Methylomirabilales bacterium]